jgi:Spy/CpxP family protein refolding chaperone
MKTTSRSLVVAALLLSFTLLAGCGPYRYHKERGWGHPRFSGRDFPERMLKHMDTKAEELDLTEGQREAYEEIRAKIKANLIQAGEDREKLFTQVREELDRENPDMKAVVGMVKGKLKDMPEHMGKALDLFLEFYSVLDEDQKAKVVEVIREKVERH